MLAANYGEAGAIDLFGPALGLPGAVSSHLTYRYWAPAATRSATRVLAVGFDKSWLASRCATLANAGVITNRAGVENEENGQGVFVCRLRGRLADVLATPS